MDINQNNDELQRAIDGITGSAEKSTDLDKQIQDQMGVPPVPEVGGMMPPAMGAVPDLTLPVTPDMAAPMPEQPGNVAPAATEPVAVPVNETVTESVAVPVNASVAPASAPAAEMAVPVAAPVSAPAQEEKELPPMLNPEMEETATVTMAAPTIGGVAGVAAMETTMAEAPKDLSAVKQEMMKELFPLMDQVEIASDEKFGLYKEMIDTTNDDSMIPAAYETAKGIDDRKQKAEALLYLIRKAE